MTNSQSLVSKVNKAAFFLFLFGMSTVTIYLVLELQALFRDTREYAINCRLRFLCSLSGF